MCNCLYCYRPLLKGEKDMHTACIKKFFGTTTLPVLDYTTEQLDQLALQIIQDQTSLTGVQPKLSLHLNEHEGSKRLTIVGLWGGYILSAASYKEKFFKCISLFPVSQEKSTSSKKLVTSILGKDEYFKTALPIRS